MAKFLIYDKTTGDISRAINLPYAGEIVDISAMLDDEFDILSREIHLHQVEVNKDTGKPNTDASRLPVIKRK